MGGFQKLSCRNMITHDIFIMPKAGSFCSKSRFFAIIFTFIYFTASNGLNHRRGEATGNPGCVLRDWESPAGVQGVALEEPGWIQRLRTSFLLIHLGCRGHFASAYSLFSDLKTLLA